MTDMPRDEDISRIYREAPAAAPPPDLDRAILRAAAESVRPRRRPWWVRWSAPMAAFATVVLTVTVTLLVHEEREGGAVRPLPEGSVPSGGVPAQPGAAPPAAEQQSAAETVRVAPDTAVPAARKARPAKEAAPVEKDVPRAGSAAADKGVPRAVVAPAAKDEPPAVPATPPAAAPPLAEPKPFPAAPLRQDSAPAAPALLKAAPAQAVGGTVRTEERRKDGKALREATDAARPASPEAKAERALSAARTPEDWIEEIRRLKRDGREAAAREALAAFRRAHPEYLLPDDLR